MYVAQQRVYLTKKEGILRTDLKKYFLQSVRKINWDTYISLQFHSPPAFHSELSSRHYLLTEMSERKNGKLPEVYKAFCIFRPNPLGKKYTELWIRFHFTFSYLQLSVKKTNFHCIYFYQIKVTDLFKGVVQNIQGNSQTDQKNHSKLRGIL